MLTAARIARLASHSARAFALRPAAALRRPRHVRALVCAAAADRRPAAAHSGDGYRGSGGRAGGAEGAPNGTVLGAAAAALCAAAAAGVGVAIARDRGDPAPDPADAQHQSYGVGEEAAGGDADAGPSVAGVVWRREAGGDEAADGGTAVLACAQDGVEISNWSATYSVRPRRYYAPESVEQLHAVLAHADRMGDTLRVVGNALSPNAIGFSDDSMVSLRLMNRVLSVDRERMQVTVQPGITVRELVDALAPHGMTLQNYASIDEQQVGGFMQVGAHGTGATIPPVEEQLVSMKLLTVSGCVMHLSRESSPNLFRMAKVGLGALGIVVEATIQCVPRHRLRERTFVMTRGEVQERHAQMLRENKHLRYMWIPYTDTVVVVACNPVSDDFQLEKSEERVVDRALEDSETEDDPSLAAREMLTRQADAAAAAAASAARASGEPAESERWRGRASGDLSPKQVAGMSFTQLRDQLLAIMPADYESVRRINLAESEYWRRSQGSRVDWSDRVLGFDCGGQQWVVEVALECGTQGEPDGDDIQFALDLLDVIERNQIPAPAPIEQRWTARSTSFMSPAYSEQPDALFSWIGIIMYLPPDDPERRDLVTFNWEQYKEQCKPLWAKYGAKQHWAKIERPSTSVELAELRRHLRAAYPVNAFNEVRLLLDPHGTLSNRFIHNAFDPQVRRAW